MEDKLKPSNRTLEIMLLVVVGLNAIGSIYEIIHLMVYMTFNPTIYLPTLVFMVLSRYWICHKYAGFGWKNLILSFDIFSHIVVITEEQKTNYAMTKFKSEIENVEHGKMLVFFPDTVLVDWLKNNIKGPYYKEFNRVKFLNKKDAMMFKLVWS
jgi:hypothetical protein